MTQYILLKDGSVVEIDSCSGCPLYDKPTCRLLGESIGCNKWDISDECPLSTSRGDDE